MKINTKYEIKTPNGWESFSGIQKISKKGKSIITLERGMQLTCSLNHQIYTEHGWIKSEYLKQGQKVKTEFGFLSIVNIEKIIVESEFYDILDAGKDKCYYTNGIVSHNCQFIGSSNTLISPSKLRLLRAARPVVSNEDINVFARPEELHQYVTVVDTARGVQGDYSAFIVFDVSTLPYKVVATYKNNMISPMLYPNIVYQMSKHYNNAFILVETNDIGEQVANILRYDLEYENILTTVFNGRSGQIISGGFGQQTRMGVKTTKQVKRVGCLNFKTQVESDKLILNDDRLLYELFRFVNIGESYEAEEGHDDLVMCCVLFAWAMNQTYVVELTSVDLRQKIEQENETAMEENLLPFGVISRGEAPSENIAIAVKKNDDAWLFAGDDEYDARAAERYGFH